MATFVLRADPVPFPPDLREWDFTAPVPRRVALVLGNTDYKNVNKLPGAMKDAEQTEELLVSLGFDVKPALNVKTEDDFFTQYFDPFLKDLHGGEFVIIYFSGHGFEVGGETYLAPLEFPKSVPQNELFLHFIHEATLRRDLLERRPTYVLMIIDACRTIGGPSSASRGATKSLTLEFGDQGPTLRDNLGQTQVLRTGLAKPSNVSGNVTIFFAAEAGTPAQGSVATELSVFTAGLIEHLGEPGKEVSWVAKRVKRFVKKNTDEKQKPWFNDNSDVLAWLKPTAKTDEEHRLAWLNALRGINPRELVDDFLHLRALSPYAGAARKWLATDRTRTPRNVIRSHIASLAPERAWERARAEPDELSFSIAGTVGSLATTRSGRFQEGDFFEKSAARDSVLDDMIRNADDPPIKRTAMLTAEILTTQGEALALGEVKVRAAPSTDARILTRVGDMQPLRVEGYTTEDGRTWSIVRLSDPDVRGYVYIPEVQRDESLDIGAPLEEIYFESDPDDSTTFIDTQALERALARIRSEKRRVRWVSIATASTESKRWRMILRARASDASRVVTESGIPRGRISIAEGADFEGARIRLRIFGD